MAEISKEAITKKVGEETYVLVWVAKSGFWGAAEKGEGSIDTSSWHYAQEKGKLTREDLVRLRRINCTCDDGSLCVEFDPKGLTAECRGCCEGFCKMWDELKKLLGAK